MKLSTRLESRLEELELAMREAVVEVCRAGAAACLANASEQLTRAGQGIKHYELPNRSSAPGEPPAFQAGALLESLSVRSDDLPSGVIGADVVAGTPYAAYLEFGSSRMAPRPFLGPASELGGEAVVAAVASVPGSL